MIKEFKKFIMRGNVIELAVGVIIGAAFNKIVSSLVNDIVMPPIGLLVAKVDFKHLYVNLTGGSYETLAKAKEAGAVTINYGTFLSTIFDFLIIAFVIFVVIKQFERLKRKQAPSPTTTKECPHCISKIPLKATRCPSCTSHLVEVQMKAEGASS